MSKVLLIISIVATSMILLINFDAKRLILGSKITQAGSTDQILENFNARWNRLLSEHVDVEGNVDYEGLVLKSDQIIDILNSLGMLKINSLKGNQKLAAHINFYNFLTIAGILHFYPLNSIRDKVSKFGFNFWKDLHFQFFDTTLSLDQIEHEILRSMNEPRIHFAIVCASISCPKLLNKAYEAETLDAQLTLQSKHFFRQSKHIQWDHTRKSVRLSGIMYWFREDFGASDQNILNFIWPYLNDPLQRKIKDISEYEIGAALKYDWGLNEQEGSQIKRLNR